MKRSFLLLALITSYPLLSSDSDYIDSDNENTTYQGIVLSPLDRAFIHNDRESVGKLLDEKKSDLNQKYTFGNTLLHRVTNSKMAEILISYGANIDEKNDRGETPLQIALTREIAKTLIVNGANIDYCPLVYDDLKIFFTELKTKAKEKNMLLPHKLKEDAIQPICYKWENLKLTTKLLGIEWLE